jgi:alpha-methylacyl-CoA racemase
MRGIRVLEMVGLGPAPFATKLMADLGATVIRVDRHTDPPPSHLDPLNRNRPALRLDLRQPAALEAVRRLVPSMDAVVDPFRPGAMARLGLGPEACLEANPAIVFLSMTGWGQDGPWATVAGHDITYLALSGALYELGTADRAPFPPLNLVADYAGGSMFLVVGLLAGVMQARATGQGQVVDVAMIDGVATLLAGVAAAEAACEWDPDPLTNAIKGAAPHYNVYETSDGRHLAVGAVEPQFYRQFVAGLGVDPADLHDQWDEEHWPEQKARFAEIFRARSLAEWSQVYDGTDACVAPVLTREEAARHPQSVHRRVHGERDGVLWANPAPRFSTTPGAPSAATASGNMAALLTEAGVEQSLIADVLGRSAS